MLAPAAHSSSATVWWFCRAVCVVSLWAACQACGGSSPTNRRRGAFQIEEREMISYAVLHASVRKRCRWEKCNLFRPSIIFTSGPTVLHEEHSVQFTATQTRGQPRAHVGRSWFECAVTTSMRVAIQAALSPTTSGCATGHTRTPLRTGEELSKKKEIKPLSVLPSFLFHASPRVRLFRGHEAQQFRSP